MPWKSLLKWHLPYFNGNAPCKIPGGCGPAGSTSESEWCSLPPRFQQKGTVSKWWPFGGAAFGEEFVCLRLIKLPVMRERSGAGNSINTSPHTADTATSTLTSPQYLTMVISHLSSQAGVKVTVERIRSELRSHVINQQSASPSVHSIILSAALSRVIKWVIKMLQLNSNPFWKAGGDRNVDRMQVGDEPEYSGGQFSVVATPISLPCTLHHHQSSHTPARPQL